MTLKSGASGYISVIVHIRQHSFRSSAFIDASSFGRSEERTTSVDRRPFRSRCRAGTQVVAEQIRLLIVEVCPLETDQILSILRESGFDPIVHQIGSEVEFLAYATLLIELIIVAAEAESPNVFRSLHLLQERGLKIPLLVVADNRSEEVAVSAVRQGAAGYLPRANLATVGVSVRQVLSQCGSGSKGVRSNVPQDGQKRQRQWAPGAQPAIETRNAELALGTSEERLRHIILNSPFPAMVHADDGEILLLSNSWVEVTGYSSDELATVCDWAHRAYRDRHESELARILELHDTKTRRSIGETQFLSKSGMPLTWDLWVTPLGSLPDGRRFALSMAANTTDRKQSQELLKLRDRAIQSVTQGILITDASAQDNPIIYASASFSRMTGYSTADVLGRNCRFLQGPETDPVAVETLRNAIKQGIPCTVEILNYRNDGSQFWNEVSVSPIFDESGTLTHFVGTQSDITERRRMEYQLHQMQKMEAIGRLAGGIAHDFNNLLTIINGYSDVLTDQLAADDPHLHFARQIKVAGERAAALTQQLLAFSRRQVLRGTELNLNSVVTSLEQILRRLIDENIEIVLELAATRPTILGDQSQIEQVILNLCLNARDSMPFGGTLKVSTRDTCFDGSVSCSAESSTPASEVVLAVADTGCGIEKSVLPQIFEPFFSTKDRDRGTGLGLATVYGIVKQSGGRIDVKSEVGVGTTFEVHFSSHPESTSTSATITPSAPEQLNGDETVLLVENEDGVRALAARFLRARGYDILEASNASEAIDVFVSSKVKISLVISDIVMPGMSGRELCEDLRRRDPSVTVVYMSAYTEDAIVRHGVLSSSFEFLPKPFTDLSLATKVRQVLDRTQ